MSCAVLADQRALHLAHLRVAERIERGAAQPLHRPQGLERGREPGAEPDLLLEAQRAEQRRVQVPVRPRPSGRTSRWSCAASAGVEMQARDLVLVLVGHQLVEVPRDRLRQPRAARGALHLDLGHAAHELHVLARVGRVLVRDQLGHADLEQAPELARAPPRDRPARAPPRSARAAPRRPCAVAWATAASTCVRSTTAMRPQRNASRFMSTDDAVDADGALDRRGRDRQRARLVGRARA